MFATAQTNRLEWTKFIWYVLHSLIRLMFHSGAPRVPATSSLDQAISRAHADTIKILIAQGYRYQYQKYPRRLHPTVEEKKPFFQITGGLRHRNTSHLTSWFYSGFHCCRYFWQFTPVPTQPTSKPRHTIPGAIMSPAMICAALNSIMHRLQGAAVFAGAQPGVRVFLHLEGQGGEACVLMGTVAEGLVS
jgi:hypothetical protein